MSKTQSPTKKYIEFIGGPFDGFRKQYHASVKQLPRDVVWLVSETAFVQLSLHRNSDEQEQLRLTSVAVYELNLTGSLPQYRHTGSVSVQNFSDAMRKLEKQDH